MQLKIVESKDIEEGKHTGKITRLAERLEPFHYLDIYIGMDNGDVELKYGCALGESSKVSAKGKLGRLLALFTEMKPGENVDPEKVLVGRKVSFMTMNEQTERGTFARIVEGSIRSI